MQRILISSLVATALTLSGCASTPEGQKNSETAGKGALIGAIAGAVIGKATGSKHVGRDAALGAAAGGLGGYIWSQKMEKQRLEMEKATAGTGIDVSKTENNELKLEVPSDFSFDVGQAVIKPNMRPVLNKLADTLNQNGASKVRIIGHTDSTGTDAINNPLSVNRAAASRDYLTAAGVMGNRISIDGRGASEPVADNGSTQGRARNRRVEIYVAEQGKS